MGTYLSVLAHHHQDTYLHTLRVSALCIDIGLENELDPPLLMHLGYAGLLHDIGKALVPKELLTKTTQLSSLEQHMMREHVRLGFRILEEFKPEIVKEIVVGHHEFSNSPYPRDGFDRRFALRRSNQRRDQHENIGQAVQILVVADIFDALIQPRACEAPPAKAGGASPKSRNTPFSSPI